MEQELSLAELQEMVAVCLDEIVNLKQENAQLKNQSTMLEKMLTDMVGTQKNLIENISQCFQNIETNRHFINHALDNIKYEIADWTPGEDQYKISFYDFETTINGIVNEGKSLVRFGDADFAIMTGYARQRYQRYDDELADRLRKIIKQDEDRLMIAIADNYGSLEKYNEDGKQGIRAYMTKKVRLEHRLWIDVKRKYHNAYITRPYALYEDNKTTEPMERFKKLKRIWNKRNVIFVEGELTRLGVGNDLFDNASRIRRIEGPATSSYDKYNEILRAALKYAEQDVLFLVALGPTARVMVYDLYKAGYQAVDIGHADLEYEWYLRGTGGRSEIEYKYNNELCGGDRVKDICDDQYTSQVIARIR